MRQMRAAGLVVLIAGCGGDPTGSTPSGRVAQVSIIAGNAQTDTVGRELTQVVRVKATDVGGLPVKGQAITFVVTKGGGKVFAGTANTSDSGTALERWTLGTTAGPQELEARAVDQMTGAALTFATVTAAGLPSHPRSILFRRADTGAEINEVGVFLGPLALKSLALARDTFSNPIPGPNLTVLPFRALPIKADTVVGSAPSRDSLQVQSGSATSGVLRVNFLRDFRLNKWRLTYRCSAPGTTNPPQVGIPDSIAYRLASDSVGYQLQPAAGSYNAEVTFGWSGYIVRWYPGDIQDSIAWHRETVHSEHATAIFISPDSAVIGADGAVGGTWPCFNGLTTGSVADQQWSYDVRTPLTLTVIP